MYWKKMRRYYDGLHDINYMTGAFLDDMDIPWTPAQSADGYIHIETQIEPEIPDFEFSPRNDYPYENAKMREDVVRHICDVNEMTEMNTRNERRLNIYGSAVWKAGWGKTASSDGFYDVVVENPKPEQMYVDPSASSLDGAEYVAYVAWLAHGL